MQQAGKSTAQPIGVIVMGPSGIGKTTTAELLAARLGWSFAEGDSFHPAANKAKMASGIPLNDADRAPWLATIRDWISAEADAGRNVVITCSALKRHYRDILRQAHADVRFLELVADQDIVAQRVATRTGHFMPASLLASQFATLEDLDDDEKGIKVAVDAPPGEVVDNALSRLGLDAPAH